MVYATVLIILINGETGHIHILTVLAKVSLLVDKHLEL